jgi:hypothetical protein
MDASIENAVTNKRVPVGALLFGVMVDARGV